MRYLTSAHEARVASLKELARTCREFSDDLDIEFFFTSALGKYYFPDMYEETHSGLDTVAGHMIYRLSDRIPQEERERTILAPAETGTVIDGGERYDTLEDWRRKWERTHAAIPAFTRELSDILLLE